MGSELIIIPIIFGAIFGVFYLYFSTRNKERLALIEKGADASIFMKGKGHFIISYLLCFLFFEQGFRKFNLTQISY